MTNEKKPGRPVAKRQPKKPTNEVEALRPTEGEISNGEPHECFIGFRRIGSSPLRASVFVNQDLENVYKWKQERTEQESGKNNIAANSVAEESDEPEDFEEEGIDELLTRCRESLSAFHTVISTTLVMMPAVRANYVDREIYGYAGKEYDVILSEGKYEIFGISKSHRSKVNRHVRRLKELDKGMELMPPAILMSMVATFDTMISDLIRILIRKNPSRFNNSSRNLSVKDILSMESFDDVRAKILDDEIDSLMRGSHEEQIAYIEENFGIKIRSTYNRWPEFIEIFERRNLAAHGSLVVNRRYISNCKSAGYDTSSINIGDVLELSGKYLKNSVDLFLEFSLLTLLVLWKKVCPSEAVDATVLFSDELYELIKDGRTAAAARLLDFVLNKQKPVVEDAITKMMTINLAISLLKEKDKEGCVAVLDKTDWSSASLEFKICAAAIRENTEEVVTMMPAAVNAELVSLENFKEWPAFDWIRKSSDFQDSLKSIFGNEAIDLMQDGELGA